VLRPRNIRSPLPLAKATESSHSARAIKDGVIAEEAELEARAPMKAIAGQPRRPSDDDCIGIGMSFRAPALPGAAKEEELDIQRKQ
jgi:hypothetical protein